MKQENRPFFIKKVVTTTSCMGHGPVNLTAWL